MTNQATLLQHGIELPTTRLLRLLQVLSISPLKEVIKQLLTRHLTRTLITHIHARQEASQRVIQDGDLVGFDTDMVGPMGYFADISRTLHCGPSRPTQAQKALYREAVAEVEHNMALIRPGVTLNQFRERARAMDERFHAQAYTCMLHAVGMCDEYPQIKHPWQEQPYDCEFEAGMVLCVESYCGEVGGRDGVKLEQQVLVTDDGIELLSDYPWDARLMD